MQASSSNNNKEGGGTVIVSTCSESSVEVMNASIVDTSSATPSSTETTSPSADEVAAEEEHDDTSTSSNIMERSGETRNNNNQEEEQEHDNRQQHQHQHQHHQQQQQQQQQHSEYELKRLRNIERNNRRLIKLGLGNGVSGTGNKSGSIGNNKSATSSSHSLASPEMKRPPVNTITPQKESKQQRRISTRIQKVKKQQQQQQQQQHEDNDDDDDVPEYDGDETAAATNQQNEAQSHEEQPKHINGYYEVEEILDRRIRKIKNDPGRKVVEYKVRWKCTSLTADEEPTCWLIAENLDQNSLASAFRQFPVDLDPDDRRRSNVVAATTTTPAINGKIQQQRRQKEISETPDDLFHRMATEEEQDIDAGGFSSDSEDDASLCAENDDVDDDDDNDAELQFGGDEDDYDIDQDDDYYLKDPSMKKEISHLGESEYDQPGTVELMINRRVYRVGQSFVSSENNKGRVIYTIATLIPRPRKAVCQRFVLFDDTFVCPKGFEGTYVQLAEDVTVDLTSLKLPYKRLILKLPLRYEQDNDQQRSFCYYNEEGKIQNHFPQCKPAALDLFAGVGGMSMGLKNAGFDVKFAVENNHLTAATLQANNYSSSSSNVGHVFVEDVKVFLKRCQQGHPCYPSVGDVDHIHASTPCKGFSRANRNGGKDDFRNNQQTLLFIKAIKHFKPMTATFENVPGLILKDYKRYLQSMVTSLLRMSYQVRVAVLTASFYGDAQNRRRLILWAARKDCVLPSLPIETHGPDGRHPLNTCKDALQALEEHNPMSSRSSGVVSIKSNNNNNGGGGGATTIYNHICPKLKKGNNDGNADKNSSTHHNHHQQQQQQQHDNFVLHENEPSRTILARARPHIHYKFDRFITVREAACLQSFPPTFQFFGSISNQYSQVGNAVPVKLATAVARSIAEVHGLP